MDLLEAGDSTNARAAFSSALELDEVHIPSRLQIAHLDEARGDWQSAVTGFTNIVAFDPAQVEARVRLTHLMVVAEDFAAAERHAQTAFELAPEDAEVLAALALVDRAKGDAEAATYWANRALAVDPGNRTARLVKAGLAAEAGETDAALEWLDSLIAKRPADMEVNAFKSRLLHAAGREEALRGHLAQMAELFPDPWIKNWLAYLQEQAGDAAGAYERLKAVSEQQPGDVQAALKVVEFVRREHGVGAARSEFGARIAAADPLAARQLRLDLAALEDAEGRPEEAAKVLMALIADAPDSVEGNTARLRIARRRLASGELEEARRAVDAVLKADPRRPDALGLRASMLLDQGEPDEAIEVLRVGLAEAPNDVGLSLMLARAYHLAGRPELAQDRFATATRMSDFDPEVVAAYAEFLLDSDQTRAAVYLLEAAANRHPRNNEIRARLDTARSKDAAR